MTNASVSKMDLARAVAVGIGRRGDDLGISVRIREEGDVEPRVQPARATPEQQQAFGRLNLKLHEVAQARAGQSEGRPLMEFVSGGLMLAGDANQSRADEQLGLVRSASTQDLQAVLVKTATRNRSYVEKEDAIRFDQFLVNNPDKLAALHKNDGRQYIDKHNEALRKFANMNFSEKKSQSRQANGMLTILSDEDRRVQASLSRGYKAIAAELEKRGVKPEMTGAGNSPKDRGQSEQLNVANAETSKPRRLVRGGVEVGHSR